jgi:transposase
LFASPKKIFTAPGNAISTDSRKQQHCYRLRDQISKRVHDALIRKNAARGYILHHSHSSRFSSMIGLTLPSSIFLSTRATDLRKSIDGLCGEVRNYLGCETMDGTLFVFYNGRRDKIKLLFWDRDGYWVFYKRLEAGTFQMPLITAETTRITLTSSQLQLILSGIDLTSVRQRKRFCINS